MATAKEISEARQDLEERLAIQDALDIHASRVCPDYFNSYVLKDEKGNDITNAWFHSEWQQLITEFKNIAIIAPRGHGKTEQVSVGRALWEIGIDPSIRIKLVCCNDKEAVKRLAAICQYILHSEEYHKVFPHVKPHKELPWNQHSITIERKGMAKDATIEALSITSSATGSRSDLNIYDDIVEARNAIQIPALREQIKFLFKSVWTNLLGPDGRQIYIATPWHFADLTADVKKNTSFELREYPIIDMKPIWPGVRDKKFFEDRLEMIGSTEFARAFRLVALSDDDVKIKTPWVTFYETIPMYEHLDTFVTIDPTAFKPNPKSDFCAIMAGKKDHNGVLYVVDYLRLKCTYPEFKDHVKNFVFEHDAKMVFIEDEGQQNIIYQDLVDTTDLPLDTVKTEGKSKGQRVDVIATPMRNGKIKLKGNPDKKEVDASQKELFDELTMFPCAPHDDLTDDLCYLWKVSYSGGSPVSALPISVGPKRESINMMG